MIKLQLYHIKGQLKEEYVPAFFSIPDAALKEQSEKKKKREREGEIERESVKGRERESEVET